MKKILTFMLAIIMLVSSVSFNTYAADDDATIKRVVSIVYDDSGSMDKNDNWAYASYSLQNLLALLSNNDEVNVVRMSSPSENYTLSLSTDANRNKSIKQVEQWKAIGNYTPFQAVDTAVKWLKDKNTQYENNDLVEYWLIVITDGEFQGENSNIPGYLSKIKDDMLGSKIETIFIGISDTLPGSTFDKWSKNSGNYAAKAGDKDGIVRSMAKVAALVTGRGDGNDAGILVNIDSTGKTITVKSELPLRNIVVFEQNQSVNVVSMDANGTKIDDIKSFSTKNPGYSNITGKIIHGSRADDIIPAGAITINFASPVDITDNNLKVFFDAAVEIKMIPLNSSGLELSEDDKLNLTEGQVIPFEAKAYSSDKNKEIDLSNWTNAIGGNLISNNSSYPMTYNANKNCFEGTIKLEEGSNNVYSIITLDNYFRVKSNLVTLYPRGIIKNAKADLSNALIEVPYKYVDDYEIVEQFTYQIIGGEYTGTSTLQFINIPKGITIEVNDKTVDSNGKVVVKMDNNTPAIVNVLRNKDYESKVEQIIDIESNLKEYDIDWTEDSIKQFTIKPRKREITFDSQRQYDKILVTKVKGKTLYRVVAFGDNELLGEKELENSTIIVKDGNIKYKADLVTEGDVTYIDIKDDHMLTTFMKTGKISPEITLITKYEEEGNSKLEPITIVDSIWKYLDLFLLILLIILLLGYLPFFKKRFNRNARFDIEEGKERYEGNKINVEFITRIFPYVSEKGTINSLYVIAGDSKLIKVPHTSMLEFENLKLNGDILDDEDALMHPEDDLEFLFEGKKNKYTYTLSSSFDSEDDLFSDDFGEDSSDDDLFD